MSNSSQQKQPKYWGGSAQVVDDFDRPIIDRFYDGRTVFGQWAIMNDESFLENGTGLGQGCGQMYEKQPDGRWLKVECAS